MAAVKELGEPPALVDVKARETYRRLKERLTSRSLHAAEPRTKTPVKELRPPLAPIDPQARDNFRRLKEKMAKRGACCIRIESASELGGGRIVTSEDRFNPVVRAIQTGSVGGWHTTN